MNGEIKKTLLHQEISDTTENLGVIALAEFRQENPDRLHALALQRSGDHAGLVIELFCGGPDTLTGRIWNGTTWRIIQDIRDGGWTEVEVLGQRLETSTSRGA